MRREQTDYKIKKTDGMNIQILKNDEIIGHTTCGVTSCLEHVYILEESNEKDWFIEEDGYVFKVDADEYRKETLTEEEYNKYKERLEQTEYMSKIKRSILIEDEARFLNSDKPFVEVEFIDGAKNPTIKLTTLKSETSYTREQFKNIIGYKKEESKIK